MDQATNRATELAEYDLTSPAHSCEHCRQVVIDIPADPADRGEFDWSVPYTQDQAKPAADAGCPAFQWLYEHLTCPTHGTGYDSDDELRQEVISFSTTYVQSSCSGGLRTITTPRGTTSCDM